MLLFVSSPLSFTVIKLSIFSFSSPVLAFKFKSFDEVITDCSERVTVFFAFSNNDMISFSGPSEINLSTNTFFFCPNR